MTSKTNTVTIIKRRQALDAPQAHASWMDGNRLNYVSGGKLLVFDYDYTNNQTLIAANPTYLPFFAPDYQHMYTLAAGTVAGQISLTQTALLIP